MEITTTKSDHHASSGHKKSESESDKRPVLEPGCQVWLIHNRMCLMNLAATVLSMRYSMRACLMMRCWCCFRVVYLFQPGNPGGWSQPTKCMCSCMYACMCVFQEATRCAICATWTVNVRCLEWNASMTFGRFPHVILQMGIYDKSWGFLTKKALIFGFFFCMYFVEYNNHKYRVVFKPRFVLWPPLHLRLALKELWSQNRNVVHVTHQYVDW